MTRRQLYTLCRQAVDSTPGYDYSTLRKRAKVCEKTYQDRTLSVLLIDGHLTACTYRGNCYIFPLRTRDRANVQGNLISMFASDKGAKTKVRLYQNATRLLFSDEIGDVKGDYYCQSSEDCDYADVIPIKYCGVIK